MRATKSPFAIWIALVAMLILLGVVLTACGGDDDSELACAESPGSQKDITVIAAELGDAGEGLALADCTPLYTNDVDTEKRIRCTGQCARVWMPLLVPRDGSLTTQTPGAIGPVTFVSRPEGGRQAALNGKPLYTYSEESEEGAAGDGVTDGFGGTEFTWSVVSLGEAAPRGGQPAPQGGLGPGG